MSAFATLNCYDQLLRNLPKGVFIRGRRYYYRQLVPLDAQRLIGRKEVWRSLRTDSKRIAPRRLAATISAIEAKIEITGRDAGQAFNADILNNLGRPSCGEKEIGSSTVSRNPF
ncbi:DUF6538 domain-containing protein [Pontixanthobacter luteolus]|uniref:DUF6538 domain-containing protein n=1 Tax=Pontixanthobacter luteolus TaxID=295089 RepID=UPI0034DCEC35